MKKLRKKQGEKTLRAFAKELGISAPYLVDLYKGRRNPGPAVLKQLGIEKQNQTKVTYTESA